MGTRFFRVALMSVAVAFASPTFAQESGGARAPSGRLNDTAADSINILIGQPPMSITPSAGQTRWYNIQVSPNRSYCAETAAHENEITTEVFPTLTVYSDIGGTVPIGSSNAISDGQEPDAWRQARVCFQTDGSVAVGSRYSVSIRNANPAATGMSYWVRVVETTMWASWFFQGGDYNSFVLMRNTTGVTINFVINWYDAAGTQVGTSGAQSVPAHGGVGINSKTFVPPTNVNGTVEIRHSGPPGALVGQMTSLSATTGLGFDAPLFVRDSWFGR